MRRGGETRAYILFSLCAFEACFRSVESALFIWDEGENGWREKRDARHRNSHSGYPVPARMLPCHCLGHLGGFRTAHTCVCVRVCQSDVHATPADHSCFDITI